MKNNMIRLGIALTVLGFAGLAMADWDFRNGIQRTMKTISSATDKRHPVVRIAFYGDATMGYGWTNDLLADFKQRFPNVNFQIQKKGVDKANASSLVSRAEKDIFALNADVVFFQTDGLIVDYERIVRKIRFLTTAEIVLFSRSSMASGDADCRRRIAAKYHCLFVESMDKNIRTVGEKFVLLPNAPDESPYIGTVTDVKPTDSAFQFTGNRVDVHQSGQAKGPVTLLLDGARPSSSGAVVAVDTLERHVPGWRMTLLKGIPNGRHVLSLAPTVGRVEFVTNHVKNIGVINFTVYAPPQPETFGEPLFSKAE